MANWEPPQPSIAEIRKSFEPGLSDDDLLLRWLVTKDEFNAMRDAGPVTPYTGNGQPVLGLLRNLRRHKANHVYIRKPGLKLSFAGTGELVSCPRDNRDRIRRTFCCRQGATTSSGQHHTRPHR